MRTICAMLAIVGCAHADSPSYSDRWVYCQHNLLLDNNVDEMDRLIERSAKAGYTGIVVADYKLNVLGRLDERYFKNMERLKKSAAEHKIELIPTVFPIGYSEGVLTHDPNLAEGVPVKDAPFIAKGGQLVSMSNSAKLVNGNFEEAKGDKLIGFTLQDEPGNYTFVDRDVVHAGKASVRMQDAKGNCRLSQRVTVRPWTCYRYSCWVKSRGLKRAEFKVLALGNDRALTFYESRLKSDQDWMQIEVVFNSLAETSVSLYVGAWGGFKGTIWVDDLKLEELTLVNVLRRGGCPLSVASADGKTAYDEGKDFEPVKDDTMHKNNAAGHWEFAHKGPAIKLTAKSRIKEGDEVRVGWYHPVLTHGEQVACSLLEPKVFELLADQAKRVNDLLKPKTFFMSHDEIRVTGWDRLAVDSGKTPGEMLADNVRKCVKILKDVNPAARIAVWSDMFDPNHNAVDNYYLVNGNWKGSWEGLPKEVIIANWNGEKAADSLKFFADRGHEQVLAGYYDGDLDNFRTWDAAAKNIKGVRGFMYTTWQREYGPLEEFGKAIRRK